MTVVYVDVLLLLNFMVDFVLLRVAALLAGRRFFGKRAALSALLGAVAALAIFIPQGGVALTAGVKLAASAAMVWMAFPFAGWGALLRDIFCLFSASFIFSGAMLALNLALRPEGMAVFNGVLYLDISAPMLMLVTAGCYLLTLPLGRWLRQGTGQELCEVVICEGGSACVIPALIDSGNGLCEPFSGQPAMVCGAEELRAVLPEGLGGLTLDAEAARRMGFRMIPFDSVGGEGLLPAFVPQAVRIRSAKGETPAREGSYVAVSPRRIGGGRYRAILNPAMVVPNDSKVGEAK